MDSFQRWEGDFGNLLKSIASLLDTYVTLQRSVAALHDIF